MNGSCVGARPARPRSVGLAVALVLAAGMVPVTPAAAVGGTNPAAEQQAVDRSVAEAAARGITQSISVVDRRTGARVAHSGGDQQYISESIVKLFTAAYYLVQAGGHPAESMTQTLRTMIVNSDDDIESALWNVDVVPTMAARYGLENTANGPRTGPQDWGWELITADDEATFLYAMSNDPQVAPLLMDAMAHTVSTGADGSDQYFGMNTLPGDHGSKQGWTDAGPDRSRQAQIHSVGWTDRYFVAILETSVGPDVDEMMQASTAAAWAVFEAQDDTADAASTPPAPESTIAPESTTAPPAAPGALAGLIAALRHDFQVLVADVTALIENW